MEIIMKAIIQMIKEMEREYSKLIKEKSTKGITNLTRDMDKAHK